MQITPVLHAFDPPGRLGAALAEFARAEAMQLFCCGPVDGRPVVYQHGWPGGGVEIALARAAAWRQGVQLIGWDRPGYGGSRFRRWPTIRAGARFVEQLVDALGLARVGLLGVSGGGPCTAATAARLGPRIAATALICAMGPTSYAPGLAGMPPQLRWGLRLARDLPAAAPVILGLVGRSLLNRAPQVPMQLLTPFMPAADRAIVAQPRLRRILTAAYGRAFAQGCRGPVQDLLLYTRDFDIAFERISAPTIVWHGDADQTVALAYSTFYTQAIPTAEPRVFPGQGHFSMAQAFTDEVLAFIVEAW